MTNVSEVIGHPLMAATQTGGLNKDLSSTIQIPRQNPPLAMNDCIEEVASDNELNQSIQSVIHRSYFDVQHDSQWQPAKVQKLNNPQLHREYEEKKKELLMSGRKEEEIEDNFGFVIQNGMNELQCMVVNGLQTKESNYNPLGYNRLGVYLCRYADICLQQATNNKPESGVIRLLVCKYMLGRTTTAIPRVSTSTEFIEPTQGYDAHQCALIPQEGVPIQTLFDRSQVYLYEIDKLLRPSTRPRHILPYAIVSYTIHGVQHPDIDLKPSVPVTAPLATQIQTDRNASDSETCESPLNQLQGLPGYNNCTTEGLNGSTGTGLGNLMNIATDSNLSPNPGILQATIGSAIPVSGSSHMLIDQRLSNGMSSLSSSASGGNSDGVEKSPQVQAIVNQINARLEAQEKNKLAMNVGALTGSSIMTGSTSPGSRAAAANGCLTSSSNSGLILGGVQSPTSASQPAMLAGIVAENASSGSVMPKLANIAHGNLGLAGALGTTGAMASSPQYSDPASLAMRGLSPLSYIPGTSIAMSSSRPHLTQASVAQNGFPSALAGVPKPGIDYAAQLAAAMAAANGGNFYGHFQSPGGGVGINPMDTLGAMGLGSQAQAAGHSLSAPGYPGLTPIGGGMSGGLAALQQSALAMNRSATAQNPLKRAFSDTGPMMDFDKRPKLF